MMPLVQNSKPVRQLWGERASDNAIVALVEFASSVICLHSYHQTQDRLLLVSAACLILFAIDRSVGCLAIASQWARRTLKNAGWYWPYRRLIQKSLTISIGLVAAAVLARPRMIIGQLSAPRLMIWYALVALGSFILLRSVSLHELDGLLYRRRRILPSLRLSMSIEIALAMVIVVSSAVAT